MTKGRGGGGWHQWPRRREGRWPDDGYVLKMGPT